jgi:hypothetical protein
MFAYPRRNSHPLSVVLDHGFLVFVYLEIE